ncbi:MAG TPA: flagellar basal body-associated FliL family protein [Ideonella sp.]|nr:flagellar basal body-associated FliL family protein [Ideonella sp.]
MSAAAAAAPAGDAGPKKGKKKLIVILAAVLLLAALGGGAAVLMMKKGAAEHAEAEDGAEGEHAPKKAKKERKKVDPHVLPVFVPLDPFVVNLADRESDRFAQIGITLQVDDAKAADEIKAYLPAIRNNILLLLSHKTSQEMLQAEGKERLARQVLREAVRPMGFDLEDEDEEEEEAAASAPAARKKKKRRAYDDPDDAPVRSVQFSSFIIQ